MLYHTNQRDIYDYGIRNTIEDDRIDYFIDEVIYLILNPFVKLWNLITNAL